MIKSSSNRWSLLPSGRLLFMLSAASLSLGSAGQTQSGRKVNLRAPQTRLTALAPRKQAAAPPAQGELPKTQIGDLTISKSLKSEVVLGTGALRWLGPNTEIEVPDKASDSVLYVHADDIQASRVGKVQIGLITLSGNVRYRLVQQSDQGERLLEGTAGHAEVRRVVRRIEFTGGVRVRLTEKARFSSPATLRTGALTLAMDAKPFHYTLNGAAGANDIQFTPLQAAPVKAGAKPKGPIPLGTIHLYGFRTGDLQFGKAVHLQGAGTACEFASPDDKTSWKLQGEQFEGEFVPDSSDLERATVTQKVHFHLMQPSADAKSKTIADGTCRQASYVRSDEGQELVAHGPLNIDFTDPQHFEEPMTLTAESSATLTVKKEGESLSFSVDDPKQTQKLHIVPKTLEESAPKTAAPPVPAVKKK